MKKLQTSNCDCCKQSFERSLIKFNIENGLLMCSICLTKFKDHEMAAWNNLDFGTVNVINFFQAQHVISLYETQLFLEPNSEEKRMTQIFKVLEAVRKEYSLDTALKTKEISLIRHLIFWWLYKNTKLKLREISEKMPRVNDKAYNHASVSHGIRKINNLIETNDPQVLEKAKVYLRPFWGLEPKKK